MRTAQKDLAADVHSRRFPRRSGWALLILAFAVSGCAHEPTPASPPAAGPPPPELVSPPLAEVNASEPPRLVDLPAKEIVSGLASFYSDMFEGRQTASGQIFDNDHLIAAHPSYPFDTRVRVTNLKNERSVEVIINDRGPTEPNQQEGVIIDLSRAAATQLGMLRDGRAPVRVEVLEWGKDA